MPTFREISKTDFGFEFNQFNGDLLTDETEIHEVGTTGNSEILQTNDPKQKTMGIHDTVQTRKPTFFFLHNDNNFKSHISHTNLLILVYRTLHAVYIHTWLTAANPTPHTEAKRQNLLRNFPEVLPLVRLSLLTHAVMLISIHSMSQATRRFRYFPKIKYTTFKCHKFAVDQ